MTDIPRMLWFFRHSLRRGDEDALSPQGVAQARRMGQGLGEMQRVIASPAQRCLETAQAMGYTVDARYQPVSADWPALATLLPEGMGFGEIARVMREAPAAQALASLLREQWRAVAEWLSPGGSALVISHGGYVDYIAVACCSPLSAEGYASWGPPTGRAEGFSLAYVTGQFTLQRFRRLIDKDGKAQEH